MYIKKGYFSLVALSFSDTVSLDKSINADLYRNPRYSVVQIVPYGAGRPGARYLQDLSIQAAVVSSPRAHTETITRPVALADKRHQACHLVPPPPPDDVEKYSYIQRNLPYLTTVILIGSSCLIFSQLRFEAHDLALSPFLLFTATYVIYQATSLPVNFTGAGFDLAAHQARSDRGTRPPTLTWISTCPFVVSR